MSAITYHRAKMGTVVRLDGRTVGRISTYIEHGQLRYRYRPVGSLVFSVTAPTEEEVKGIIEYGRPA